MYLATNNGATFTEFEHNQDGNFEIFYLWKLMKFKKIKKNKDRRVKPWKKNKSTIIKKKESWWFTFDSHICKEHNLGN